MKNVIVVGDGDPGEDRNSQAKEFLDWATRIAITAGSGGIDCDLLVCKNANQLTELEATSKTLNAHQALKATLSTYDNVSDLMKKLPANAVGLIVIGHGFQTINATTPSAAVELCPDEKGEERYLTVNHINQVKPFIYCGLHCFSGCFVDGLKGGIVGIHLTGKDKGLGADIKALAENVNAMQRLNDLLSVAGFYEAREELFAQQKGVCLELLTASINAELPIGRKNAGFSFRQ